MKKHTFTFSLLLITTSTLILGLWLDSQKNSLSHLIWIFGALCGLIPAVKWFLDELRDKQVGSDVLAVLSILAALFTQEYLASAIIALMLATGRALEGWAEGRAERELKALVDRIPKHGTRVNSDGTLTVISLDEIALRDRLLVKSGEVVPVDGEVISSAYLDQSALTGEPIPVLMHHGATALSGTVNAGNNFEMFATTTSAKSTYSGIITMVRNSEAESAPNVRIASKWALRFVPFTLILSALSYFLTGEVSRAVAVLVVATPCPLILAVPIALVAGMSRTAKLGAIVKGGATLEKLARVNTVLLDKTGTLTYGGPAVTTILTASDFDEVEALRIAASLDQYSPHIVAKALVAKAHERGLELHSATDVKELHGREVEGLVQGAHVKVGAAPHALPHWASINNPLIVALTINNEIKAVFGLDDPIKADSQDTISGLKNLGIENIILVTGDRKEEAEKVASVLGISRAIYSSTPARKLEVVAEYRALDSGTVVAVGDGINDAPALAAADVGVAMGAKGASAASEAAHVVIVEDSIEHLVHAISIAKLARARALQASLGGMACAMAAMIAASFGYLSPSEGAVIQEVIDLLAIVWAMTTLRGAR